ncbi:hypothetical protein L7F22_002424 [Adiantum nelumboides]|nr:hypothetical protein [Adiantum nelumboides]
MAYSSASASPCWASGFEDGLANQACEKSCPNCAFLNIYSSGTCSSCGQALKRDKIPPDADIIDVSSSDHDDDDDEVFEVECNKCTLLNKAGAWACAACATPFIAPGKEPMIDFFGASSSHVYADPTGAKFSCPHCTFWNEMFASLCACCGSELGSQKLMIEKQIYPYDKEPIRGYSCASSSHIYIDSTSAKFACKTCTFLNEMSANVCACCGFALELRDVMVEDQTDIDALQAEGEPSDDYQIICQACMRKFAYGSTGCKLTNCGHEFCRSCLTTFVVECLLDLMQVEGTDQILSKYDSTMRCPLEGCGHSLSRGDLRLVVGPSIQEMLDEWLMALIRDQVFCPLVRCCPNCKDMEQQLLLPPHQFHLLRRRSLHKAFKCNGLNLPLGKHLNKSVLVQHLKNAAPLFLLCSACSILVCQSCGLSPIGGVFHKCDPLRRQCFDITRSIMKLCFAYIQATNICEKRRSCTRKVRTGMGFFFPNNKESNQLMQGQDGKGLIFKSLIKWFSYQDFEDISKIQDRNGEGHMTQNEDSAEASSQRMAASVVDKLAQKALQELTGYITQALNDNKGDVSPLIAELLCSHDVPYSLLKWLVSNESLMDIMTRGDLYWAVLGFLRALSSSWDLLPLLCGREAKHDCFATHLRWETPGSVISEFEKLYKQAQFMLRRGNHLLLCDNQESKSHEDQRKKHSELDFLFSSSLVADVVITYEKLFNKIMLWERKILQHHWLTSTNEVNSRLMASDLHHKQWLGAELKESLQKLSAYALSERSLGTVRTLSIDAEMELDGSELDEQSSAAEGDEEAKSDQAAIGAPAAALVEAYKKALRPLQFDEACLLQTHYFRHSVPKSEALMLNKRRARAINEEMTQLNTILPLEWESSIFLRMDEQRSDVLRALIIGPGGTPYENGVFLFDLLLEETYPDTPPKVQFLTTGGGTVRFNPNLYQNGKVCLSLLGTWSGPGWKAGQSSILQVLVSIQGLILVADPYFNEPGYEHSGNRRDADVYLHEQRLNTVQHSMLPALRSPDPLFKPVIDTHFQLKARHIFHQCTIWMHDSSSSSVASELKRQIDELSHELIKLTDL